VSGRPPMALWSKSFVVTNSLAYFVQNFNNEKTFFQDLE
jgi:hypothetical protein